MKMRVMFTRTYDVIVDCADDALIEHVRDRAVAMVLENEQNGPDGTVDIGKLTCEGVEPEEDE